MHYSPNRFSYGFLIVPSLLYFSFIVSISQAAENTELLPLTAYGYPDLQGLWTNPSQTPMERPLELGQQSVYTEAEAQALVARALDMDRARSAPLSPDRSAPEHGGTIDQQADGNFEIMPTEIAMVNGEYRTSLVVDPPHGRFPLKESAADIFADWIAQGHGAFDGPEIRPAGERCLNPGAQLPLLTTFFSAEVGNPGGDNPVRNIQIVQTEKYVVILAEYFSLVRIIRLDNEHLEAQGPKWMGDSIASYEGNTLKIHTNNFRPEQSGFFLRSSDQLEITESFTLISRDEILFSFTVTDPKIYSQAFTAEIPLKRMAPGQEIYEYACHEGNYSMPSILRAARMGEAQ